MKFLKFRNHKKGSPQNAMMDPFKQYSNVTTAYFRSGKINAVIRSYPGFIKQDMIVAVVIETVLKQFQMKYRHNCDDHMFIKICVLPPFKSSSSLVSQ